MGKFCSDSFCRRKFKEKFRRSGNALAAFLILNEVQRNYSVNVKQCCIARYSVAWNIKCLWGNEEGGAIHWWIKGGWVKKVEGRSRLRIPPKFKKFNFQFFRLILQDRCI